MGLTIERMALARRRRTCASLGVLLGVLIALPRGVWGGTLHVASGADGAIQLDARRAAVGEVLLALAAEGGFEVLLDDAIKRPPVTATLPAAPLENVLHNVLRDRNYALVFDANDAVSQVILLAPSPPRPLGALGRKARAIPRARQKASDRGPTVVRF
jgi:hypothetical protein